MHISFKEACLYIFNTLHNLKEKKCKAFTNFFPPTRILKTIRKSSQSMSTSTSTTTLNSDLFSKPGGGLETSIHASVLEPLGTPSAYSKTRTCRMLGVLAPSVNVESSICSVK